MVFMKQGIKFYHTTHLSFWYNRKIYSGLIFCSFYIPENGLLSVRLFLGFVSGLYFLKLWKEEEQLEINVNHNETICTFDLPQVKVKVTLCHLVWISKFPDCFLSLEPIAINLNILAEILLIIRRCAVGAHLSRSTFVLRKTDAVAFVQHETNGTSNVYPKKLICVRNVLRSSF
jgi:hypothetical protein